MNYVTLRRPARNLFRLHGEMGQMFNDLFASPNEPTDETEYRWSPSVDIAETDSGFEVRAELPGVKQEDVNVSVPRQRPHPPGRETAGGDGRR